MDNYKKLIKQLIKKGNSAQRAIEIIAEAQKSSNPNYILNYYGLKQYK